MNQGFKLRYDQMRDGNPTATPSENAQAVENSTFDPASNVRNVCLCWLDGRRLFLNYAYLISGEFIPNSDKNLIKLGFSSHMVSLTGYSLESLYLALLDHLPRFIRAEDPRYVFDETENDAIVIEIAVEKKGD